MQRDVISGRVDEDREAVARKVDKYDLFAIPILDASDMLVGIVTHDDAMDILRQEQTEDILAFGGVSADAEDDDEGNYWQGRVARRRPPPDRLAPAPVPRRLDHPLDHPLVRLGQQAVHRQLEFDAFIPLLIGTGGNAGSQTVGTVIRGLALGQIQPADTLKVVAREAAHRPGPGPAPGVRSGSSSPGRPSPTARPSAWSSPWRSWESASGPTASGPSSRSWPSGSGSTLPSSPPR